MAKKRNIKPVVLTNYQRKLMAIRADWEKLDKEKTESGKSKYTLDYKLYELSKKYFLDERTIYNIIKK